MCVFILWNNVYNNVVLGPILDIHPNYGDHNRPNFKEVFLLLLINLMISNQGWPMGGTWVAHEWILYAGVSVLLSDTPIVHLLA